jgi:predicted neuraminidase
MHTPAKKSITELNDLDGILPRCLNCIISQFQKFDNGFLVENCDLKCSFMEIYNEQITDLLDTENKIVGIRGLTGSPVRSNSHHRSTSSLINSKSKISMLSEHSLESYDQAYKLFIRGL